MQGQLKPRGTHTFEVSIHWGGVNQTYVCNVAIDTDFRTVHVSEDDIPYVTFNNVPEKDIYQPFESIALAAVRKAHPFHSADAFWAFHGSVLKWHHEGMTGPQALLIVDAEVATKQPVVKTGVPTTEFQALLDRAGFVDGVGSQQFSIVSEAAIKLIFQGMTDMSDGDATLDALGDPVSNDLQTALMAAMIRMPGLIRLVEILEVMDRTFDGLVSEADMLVLSGSEDD